MSVVTVGISDCAVSRDPAATLTTYALGSCIAVAVYDPVAGVAGLLHFMLPESSLDAAKAQSKPFMYADTGIPMLFRRAYELGAQKQRMSVVIAGGAQVLDPNNTFNIGKRNHLAVRKVLWKAGVMVNYEDVGGTAPRNLRIEASSGSIFVSCGREEREIAQKALAGKKTNHGI
jgi:chemotaxis protein CheD